MASDTDALQLLLRRAAAARSHALLALATRDDEMIVIAVTSPGPRRPIPNFNKLPVRHISRRQSQIIANCGGNIQSGPMIQIRFRALIAEDVLEMVGAKRAAILPLRIAEAISFANGYPTIAADRLPRPGVGLLEPRDYQWCFRLELAMRDVVVRQRDVEGILPRDEGYRNVIAARARLRAVRTAVIRCPIKIPTTLVVRHRIVSARFLTHPEHRRYDIHFPRVPLDRRSGAGRDKNLRFHFDQRLLPKLHCVLGEIPRRRVGRSGLFVPEDLRGTSNRQTETSRKKSHYKRRHLLSDPPLLGKANFPKTLL